jgi:SAM-dependent methyltransferase
MATHSAAYPLGGSESEKQRLLRQAEAYEPHARWLLDQIGIQPGWRVLDVGCGPIGILDLLSERVGPQGVVVGIERESRFVEMAREEIAKRGLSNASIVQADALTTGLEKESFDVVHERLVLVNVPARVEALSEMISLLRPGGTVVLEDVDNVSWLCQPPHRSWDALLNAFHTVFHANGGDGFLGRRLPELLRTAGVRNIQTKINVDIVPIDEYRRTHLVSLIDSVRDKVVGMGLMSEDELQEHRGALVSHLADPSTTVIEKLFVQCWGQKQI